MASFMGEAGQSCRGESWVIEINESLECQWMKPYPPIPRLSPSVAKSKEEAYIPQVVSYGPYYHKSEKLTCMENSKVLVCRAQIQRNNLTKDKFDCIVNEMKGMIAEIRSMYDAESADQHDDNSLALMMALDAIFALCFLTHLEDKGWSHVTAPMSSFQFQMLRDGMKLQNQLPLCVVLKVQKHFISQNTEKYKELLQHACVNLCPFHFEKPSQRKVELEGNRHFLESLCKYVSAFLVIKTDMKKRKVFRLCKDKARATMKSVLKILTLPLYLLPLLVFVCVEGRRSGTYFSKFPRGCSAVELHQVGVRFKALPSDAHQIAFEDNTLYLPTIMISKETTEVILRNLVAFEAHNLEDRQKVVTAYVDLMDTLIDTAEDVALLRRCGIIHRHYGNLNDESIALMWNGLTNAFFATYFDPPLHLASRIRETAREKESLYKDYWEEFKKRYLSKPWLATSLAAGVLLVLMNAAQVFCLFYKCMN